MAEIPSNTLRNTLRDSGVEPEIMRIGLGYQAAFRQPSIRLKITHLKTRSGETSGELTATHSAPSGHLGHLYQGRFNLSSLTARTTAAKYLGSRLEADWVSMLEQFCLGVLKLERAGEPWYDLDHVNFPVNMRALVDPILPLNVPTVVFAPFSAGKTTLAAAVALSVATGVEVVPGWRPLQGPVVILDWEDQPEPWQQRLRMLAKGAGVHGLGVIKYRSCFRPLHEDVDSVAGYCDEHQASLVIIDSLGLAAGISDGDPSESAIRLFAALRAVGRTSLLIDQVSGETAKAEAPAQKSYGSIFKMYLARVAFELRREREPGDGDAEVLMINTKSNHGPKLKPIGLRYSYAADSIRIRPASVVAHDLQAAMPHHVRLAHFLADRGPSLVALAAEELGLGAGTVRALVSRHRNQFTRLPDGTIAVVAGGLPDA